MTNVQKYALLFEAKREALKSGDYDTAFDFQYAMNQVIHESRGGKGPFASRAEYKIARRILDRL